MTHGISNPLNTKNLFILFRATFNNSKTSNSKKIYVIELILQNVQESHIFLSVIFIYILVTPTYVTWIPRLEGNSNQLFFTVSGAPFSTPRQIPLFCQWETTYKAPWVPQNLDTILRILQKRILPENVLGDASPFSSSFWLLYFQLLLLISLVR